MLLRGIPYRAHTGKQADGRDRVCQLLVAGKPWQIEKGIKQKMKGF